MKCRVLGTLSRNREKRSQRVENVQHVVVELIVFVVVPRSNVRFKRNNLKMIVQNILVKPLAVRNRARRRNVTVIVPRHALPSKEPNASGAARSPRQIASNFTHGASRVLRRRGGGVP